MNSGDYGRNGTIKYVNLNNPSALDVRLIRERFLDKFGRADAVQPQHGGGEGLEVKPQEPQNAPVAAPNPGETKVSPTEESKPEVKSPETKPEDLKTSEVENKLEEAKVELKSDEAKVGVRPEEAKLEVKPDETKVEVKPDETKVEVKLEETKVEVKPEEVKPEIDAVVANNEGGENVALDQNIVADDADWKEREAKLLKIINDLEKVKSEKSEDSLKLELKLRAEEAELLRARVKNLETQLQAALSKPSGKNHEIIENIKQQHEELLSKARGMIFDKTKMVKNQELQIEALTTQVQSLKDVNMITKDLLEIRNSEIKAMEERLQAMEARFKSEKDRFGLVLERAQTSTNINTDLRKEYETQLGIFKELRTKYDQRVQALVAENERLKASVNGASST